MKSIQNSNTGFILTSMSYAGVDKNRTATEQDSRHPETSKRSIVKYDYCTPPEEKTWDSPKK
ncbi:MAG: hypothetical protein RL172_1037 [Bacteroidota bacterium]